MLKLASISIASSVLFVSLLSGGVMLRNASIATAQQPSVPQEEPNQDNLALTCQGTIEDAVDYTAVFTRESGFHQVEFRPRTSTAVLTATMSYDGEDAQGQSTWRGSVLDAADVVLVHQANAAVQSGDRISVEYDGRVGNATCH